MNIKTLERESLQFEKRLQEMEEDAAFNMKQSPSQKGKSSEVEFAATIKGILSGISL